MKTLKDKINEKISEVQMRNDEAQAEIDNYMARQVNYADDYEEVMINKRIEKQANMVLRLDAAEETLVWVLKQLENN